MCANERGKGDHVQYYTIPILLIIMSLGLIALIYWGSFVEEKRNGRVRAR